MRIDNSFTVMANNCDMKNASTAEYVQKKLNSSSACKIHIQKCKTYLTQIAFEIISSSYNNINIMESHRLDHSTWIVTKKIVTKDVDRPLILNFKHIRTVTLIGKIFHCDCTMEANFGLPCIHVMHVADTIPVWKFPSHHDVSVSWWKVYYYYGLSISRHCHQRDIVMKIFKCFVKLRN